MIEAELKGLDCPIYAAVEPLSAAGWQWRKCRGSDCPMWRVLKKTEITADGQSVELETDQVYCGMGGKP